jgi:hypothetical protein
VADCLRCSHPDDAHDSLGMCDLCQCVTLMTEEDEWESDIGSGEGPEELYLGEEGS